MDEGAVRAAVGKGDAEGDQFLLAAGQLREPRDTTRGERKGASGVRMVSAFM